MSALTAVITTASAGRADHLRRQRRFLAALGDSGVFRIEAWLDAEAPREDDGALSLHVPPGADGLRVGAARNAAAAAAIDRGADLLVFLDVDCLPGPSLLSGYRRAATAHPDAVLAGAVTYLASVQRPARLDDLPGLTRPHPARPAPVPGSSRAATAAEYDLFWSLSFAVTPETWQRVGGFHEEYEGYGAEDTDLAWRARERGTPLRWIGGADAFHQWHPTSSPPRQHVDDILRNGAIFAKRWGAWPMSGWLEAFAAEGLVVRDGPGWRRAPRP